jgi:hypothetical protein
MGIPNLGALLSGSDRRPVAGTPQPRRVNTVVFALIPEFEQVKVKDDQGHVYALTRKTRGVDLRLLHEGQRVVCMVTPGPARVLSAEALA